MADLTKDLERLRAQASDYFPGRQSAEWACDYSHWNDLYTAVLGHQAVPSDARSDEEFGAVLCALARDDEIEHIAAEIASAAR